MIADPKQPASAVSAPAWAGPVKFFLLLAITFGLFFLVNSMVEHHFFEGTNYPNRSQVTEPVEPQ